MAGANGHRHRGATVVGTGVDLGSMFQQEVDEIAPAQERRLLKRGEPLRLPHERVGSAFEQELRRLVLTGEERGLQRGVLELRPRQILRLEPGAPRQIDLDQLGGNVLFEQRDANPQREGGQRMIVDFYRGGGLVPVDRAQETASS